jgi:hypothetical protein
MVASCGLDRKVGTHVVVRPESSTGNPDRCVLHHARFKGYSDRPTFVELVTVLRTATAANTGRRQRRPHRGRVLGPARRPSRAAPRELNDGLRTEIKMVAEEIGHDRIVLLLGPVRRSKVALRRWRSFYDEAAQFPVFTESARAVGPASAQVAVHLGGGRWRGWGSAARDRRELRRKHAKGHGGRRDPLGRRSIRTGAM